MFGKLENFQVPLTSHLLSKTVQATRPLWVALGDLETKKLAEQLENVEITRPVYVTGLARAGTTILLEFLASHPHVGTHQYRDFPVGVFVPYWWHQSQPQNSTAPAEERAHGDGLKVTPASPEAIEECLWMYFFRSAHNPDESNLLDESTSNSRFEKFYREHIRKLLLTRGTSRYASKGNYNLSRLPYLQKLFPDARFVVAIRQPKNHIASLMKQHRLFSNAEANYPRALAYMQNVGHFEFGLDRRPINTGNSEHITAVKEFWRRGEEVRGWACYWAGLYGWLHDQLEANAQLREAVHLVRFEDCCNQPNEILSGVLDHANLQDSRVLAEFASRIAAPNYYEPNFSPEEESIIAEETTAVAAKFGYETFREPAVV